MRLREGKQENSGPPSLGLGLALITSRHKIDLITKTALLTNHCREPAVLTLHSENMKEKKFLKPLEVLFVYVMEGAN